MNYGYKLRTKVFVWFLSFCLVITLIPDIGFAAENQDTENAGVQIEKTMQADIADDTAMTGLNETAVIDKTETTTTYDAGEGMKTVVLHGGQVRFEDEDGNLTDYDPTLVAIKDGEKTEMLEPLTGYEFRNNIGDKKQYLPEKLSESTPVIMEYENHKITLIPTDETVSYLGIGESTVKLEEEVIPSVYEGEGELLPVNAVYGSDEDIAILTYQSGDAGIKETVTLNEEPDTNVFTYEISIGALQIKENVLDEGLTVIDPETDDIVAGIEAPWMNDASGDAYSTDITYDLEPAQGEEGTYILTMTVSEDYLSDPERAYPVTIDPTVTWKGNDMIRDTYVITGSGYANTNFYETSNTKMPVGENSTGRHRTLFKILNLKAEIEGKSVESAKLTLYESGTGSSGQIIRANRLIEDWTPSSVTWNNQPAWNTEAYTDQVTTSGTQNTAKVFDCTAFARNVANGTSNYGLILRNMTTDLGYACFWGSRYGTTTYRPKLVVTYYDKVTAPATLSFKRKEGETFSFTNYFRYGKVVYTNWTGIKSDNLTSVQYKVLGINGTANPTSVAADGVDLTQYRGIGLAAKSATNKWTSYTQYLPDGTYRLYLRGKDGAGNAGPAKSKVFYVDSVKPTIDGVTVTPVTTATSPTNNTTPEITYNVNDTYFDKLTVSVDGGEESAVTSKKGSGTFVLPENLIESKGSQQYTITLTAYDKSGNKQTHNITYYADAVKPEITEFTVTPETDVAVPSANRTPTVSWAVTENSIESIELFAGDNKVGTSSVSAASTGYTFSSSEISVSGSHDLTLKVTDTAGNVSEKMIQYNLDIDAPEIENVETIPETGLVSKSGNRSPYLTWTVTDAAGITMYYSMNGSTWNEMGTDATGSFMLPSNVWTNTSGQNTVYVKAVDSAGNTSNVENISYYLETGGSFLPQDLTVHESYGKNVLTWDIDAYIDGEYIYQVHRSTSAGFTPSAATCIDDDIYAASGHYIDKEILTTGTYYYKILVKDADGTSADQVTGEISVNCTTDLNDFVNTLGFKDYLSYTEVGLPNGTISVEESSGNLIYEQGDFSIANPQLDYGLTRTYNSKADKTSMLGTGWMDSYHKEIYTDGNDIYLQESDGSVYLFENGVGKSIDSKYYTFAKTEQGYTVTTNDNVTYKFNHFGQLIEISEAHGCKVTNIYDQKGRIAKVISSSHGTETKILHFKYHDGSDLLDYIIDLNGTEYSYTYNGKVLTAVTVTGGGKTLNYSYGYDSAGLLKDIYDGMGNKYSVTYSSKKVSELTYPDNESITFAYAFDETVIKRMTSSDKLISETVTEFNDSTGKVLSHTDPDNVKTTFTYYTSSGYELKESKRDNEYQTVSGESISKVSVASDVMESYSYDSNGNITSAVSANGDVTTYQYNNKNNVTSEITVNGSDTISSISYSYSGNGLDVMTETDNITGIVTKYTYNSDGSETFMKEIEDSITISSQQTLYDSNGNVRYEKTVSGPERSSSSVVKTVEYANDAMGNVTSETTAGKETVIQYDAFGRAVNTAITEDGFSEQVTVSEYDGNGTLTKEIVSGGTTTEYSYDSRNRNVATTVTGSGIKTRISSIVYGFAENVTIHNGSGTVTKALLSTETRKDTAGNITGVSYIDANGNTVKEVAGNTYTDYTYDKNGNQITSYTGSTSDNALKEVTVSAYDISGNSIAQISDPSVSGSTYTAAGDAVLTETQYNSKGEVIAETDGKDVSTSYSYDDQGRVISVNVAGGVTEVSADYALNTKGETVTTITEAGTVVKPEIGEGEAQAVSETENISVVKTETVNGAGLVTETRDESLSSEVASDISTNYRYDSLGRKDREMFGTGHAEYTYMGDTDKVSSRKVYSGNTLEHEVIYSYDNKGRVTEIINKDGLGNEVSKYVYSYDLEDKLLSEKVRYDGGSFAETSFTYDSEGRIETKTYPAEAGIGTVKYAYDSQGRISAISVNSKVLREYVYDGLGRVSVIKDFDGPGSSTYIHKAFTYDSLGRVTDAVYRDNGATGNILERFVYEYDKNSNITEVTHVNNLLSPAKNETRVYSYDQHGRLTQSVKTDNTDASTETAVYTYDNAGNRLTETVDGVTTEYTYNELNQLTGQVTEDSETLYLYDERGNQIHAETIAEDETVSTVDMEYSIMGEMTTRTEKTGDTTTLTQTNVYDQDGQRIKRTQDGTSRQYFYDSGVVLYTKDGSTISSANVLSDSGTAIGTYRSSTYHTYLKDMQGSTTNLVKSDGTLSAAYDYTDFGETTELAGAAFDNQIRYTGGIYDEETGLYYLNARYYDPETGRFISQDSYRGKIDDPNQWHLYVYCANNPINYVDPSGHLNVTFTRSQARDQYVALQGIRVAYQLWSAVNFYKKMVKKAVIEILEAALKDQALSIIYSYSVGVIFNKYLEGFYKGGYGKHKVYKYRTVKRHKKKVKVKYKTYENITKTKLTGKIIYPKFKYTSKNETSYMFY